jgi:hypothetical protein
MVGPAVEKKAKKVVEQEGIPTRVLDQLLNLLVAPFRWGFGVSS